MQYSYSNNIVLLMLDEMQVVQGVKLLSKNGQKNACRTFLMTM